mgnify:FL=1
MISSDTNDRPHMFRRQKKFQSLGILLFGVLVVGGAGTGGTGGCGGGVGGGGGGVVGGCGGGGGVHAVVVRGGGVVGKVVVGERFFSLSRSAART